MARTVHRSQSQIMKRLQRVKLRRSARKQIRPPRSTPQPTAAPVTPARARRQLVIKPDFSEQLARTGRSITELADQSGVSRQLIYRLQDPQRYRSEGTIRAPNAWRIARVYATHMHIDEHIAFERLFRYTDLPQQPTDDVPDDQPESDVELPDPISQQYQRKASVADAEKPLGASDFRVDAATLAMLQVLMYYEDRSRSDMLRVLIQRAYRALPAEVRNAQGQNTAGMEDESPHRE